MPFQPFVSVIISADGRLDSLKRTLDSVRLLEYPSFELCVVCGPTSDGTLEFLERRKTDIKIAQCPTRNLSLSRNTGIAMAAGEILAFLDDGAIPQSEWLAELVQPFEQPDVGACGGLLHDSTGIGYQWRFGIVDRLGVPDESWERPPIEFNFPYTAKFVRLMAANSAFRRSAVIAVGGFDEQYEYYLDATDLICRLVDHGWRIVPIDGAVVHHKLPPSHLQNQSVINRWSQLVKSKIYFSLVNSHGHHSISQALESTIEFIEGLRTNLELRISEGSIFEMDRFRFASEVDSGLQGGLRAGLARARHFANRKQLEHGARAFLRFPVLVPIGERRTICLLTKTYPPAAIDGIGRNISQLAWAMTRLGHQVHVLTHSAEHDSVDFEDGVWVHRISSKLQSAVTVQGISVPQPIWNYSATMLAEVQRIAQSRKVDAVIAPIRDCEGIAFLVDGSYRLVTGLYSTIEGSLQITRNRGSRADYPKSFIRPLLPLEKLLLEQSDGILADSQAIIRDIKDADGLRFKAVKIGSVLPGLDDWSSEPVIEPQPLPHGAIRVLFVGDLEECKGIDIFLRTAKAILPSYPQVHLDIVSDDTLLGANDRTYREVFDADREVASMRDRIHFHSKMSEPMLRGFYRAFDIFISPRHFESSLIAVEAMMFSKPVIGCRAGCMPEIIEHGVSGLLAEPGNVESLSGCLRQLVADPRLRADLGDGARRRYLTCFTAEAMARATLEFVAQLPEKAVAASQDQVGAVASAARPRLEPAVAAAPQLGRHRIAIINGILARNDAISAAVRDMYDMLAADPAFDVSVFAASNDFSELPCQIVNDTAQLLLEPNYLNADLIIWHFGIYYELFNAILLGNGGARQVVVFHNITPKEYASETLLPLIDRSLEQSHNMRRADEVWNDSQLNAQVARTIGVPAQRIRVIPLCVDAPPLSALSEKESTTLDVLFVGRFVKSKGVLDLLDAVARLPRRELAPFRLTLAGNIQLSDSLYVEAIRQRISASDLSRHVCFLGTVDEVAWAQLYRRAHIVVVPSYHEGFCKPVIEGLRAGCIPVGYASSNLPEITAGLGRLVATGNVAGLAAVLSELLSALPGALSQPMQQRLALDRGRLSVAAFDAASRDYVERFTSKRIDRALRDRVNALLEIDRDGSDVTTLQFNQAIAAA